MTLYVAWYTVSCMKVLVSKQVAFRFTRDLLRRIDRYAEQLVKKTGARVTRADAVRMLLKRGLDAEGMK